MRTSIDQNKKLDMRAIVAINKGRYIGKDGDMMWHSPEDLKHFFNKTKHTTCLIGRKTYDSLPDFMKKKDARGGRTYLIVSRNPDKGIPLSQALLCKPDWVIGGGEIYEATRHLWKEVHISNINDTQVGDTQFNVVIPFGCKVFEYEFNIKE
jgi:dihydrofolate reductase